MPDLGGGGHILGQIPHCMEQNSSQMPGVCPGGGGGSFELSGTYNLDTHVKRDK